MPKSEEEQIDISKLGERTSKLNKLFSHYLINKFFFPKKFN